ncbi:MAG: helix-turn-helix transcriptional regulator, partial [Cyclobacteriaceae bacterium]|nr:helix-turn-helix transcriptional regulator [Cyclobacteriaceae bacterium HetDA_MAG_MS6]
FLLVASQGFFLAVLLMLKRKHGAENILGMIIFLFSLMLSYFVAFWTGYAKIMTPIFSLTLGLPLIIAPLYYYLVRSIVKVGATFSYWHLLPFATYLTLWFTIGFIPFFGVSLLVHLSVYAFLIIKASKSKKVVWVTVGYFALVAGYFSYYILLWTNLLEPTYDYMISVAMSVFIFYAGYISFIQSGWSIGPKQVIGFSRRDLHHVYEKLERYYQQERPYLTGDFKLPDLAAGTGFSVHQVSEAINSCAKLNFNDWTNAWRIDKAKELLLSSDLKIESVAFSSGFNNKVSFFSAFRKHTGTTPTGWRRHHENLVLAQDQDIDHPLTWYQSSDQ